MNTNLEPGCLCVVLGSRHDVNNGKVVKLIRYHGPLCPYTGVIIPGDRWWEVEGAEIIFAAKYEAQNILTGEKSYETRSYKGPYADSQILFRISDPDQQTLTINEEELAL